jgi:Tripartite tricarboxylate transporter TctA family
MLAGIDYGAMYGGSTTSILANVPGEPASVVTAIDGYRMARKGRAGAHSPREDSGRSGRRPASAASRARSRSCFAAGIRPLSGR